MNELTLEKLQYLIKGLSGRDVPTDILKSATSNRVSLKDFQQACETGVGIPKPMDPRAEKYKDIKLYSQEMFERLAVEKFPDKVVVNLPGIDAASLNRYLNRHTLKENAYYPAYVNTPQDNPQMLDVRLELTPEDYGLMWPDTTDYEDIEMDLWLIDEYPDISGSEAYRSVWSNFIRKHPDLTGGLLMFSWPDEKLHANLMVEGRPFHEAMRAVVQKPGITTAELKELLAVPEKMRLYIAGDTDAKRKETANIVMGDEYTYVYQQGVDGYMCVDRSRHLTEYGQPLSDKLRRSFRDIVNNRQLVQGKDKLFFHDYNNDRPEPARHQFLDKDTWKQQSLEEHVLIDGKKVYADVRGALNKVIVGPEQLERMIDLTDRIRDIETHVKNKGSYFEHLMVRCKVDGEQQPFTELPMALRIEYNRTSSPQAKENMLLTFLAAEHKDMLLGVQQEQQRGRSLK